MFGDQFKITAFLDEARWSRKSNYNQINFYKSDLSNDTKILTHWLCYITDRQTPFERVWSVGGFIFSELVDIIKKEKTLDLLNSQSANSFFIKRGDYQYKDQYKFNSEDYDKQIFVSRSKARNNKRLLSYNLKTGTTAHFIPRYYPSDYRSILSTFCILREYDYNFSRLLITILTKLDGEEGLIPKLLYSLYLLTYYDIGQPKYTDISDYKKETKRAKRRSDRVIRIINDGKSFSEGFESFKNGAIYNQKRAWCSLRDFFKSPEFSDYFYGALKQEEYDKIDLLKSKAILSQFELPGDVWNNNPKFRSCILQNTKYLKRNKDSLAKILRDIHDEENIPEGYPEQFDITFDLVPRMCEKDNCDICPFGIINGKNEEFKKICIKDTLYYCPVLLTSCNYKMKCKGANCELYNIFKKYNKGV